MDGARLAAWRRNARSRETIWRTAGKRLAKLQKNYEESCLRIEAWRENKLRDLEARKNELRDLDSGAP